jgi:hypothetical protein
MMNKRNLYLFLALAVAVVGLGIGTGWAADVTINVPTTFALADASDGAIDGTFTVTGDLTITGTGSITSNGGDIIIVVDGKFTMLDGALITSSAAGNGAPGDITITVTGDINMEPGSEVNANAAANAGGAIVITSSLGNIDIDGLVESTSTRSGTGAFQGPGGGPITITAFCELIITDEGIVRSVGKDPGADLVHLEACDVVIYGLVQSTGPGHAVPNSPVNHLNSTNRPDKPANSTAGVEVWAGSILVDKTGIHNGEIDADLCCGGGTQGTSWIDLFASGDITIVGETSGNYVVHANGNSGSSDTGGVVTIESIGGKVATSGLAVQADGTNNGGKIFIEANKDVGITGLTADGADFGVSASGPSFTNGNGGQITVKSETGKVTADGFALQADMINGGGDGGQILIEASSDVMLDDAQINSRGDWVPTIGNGGLVTIRSYNTLISWQDTVAAPLAIGDVRPTGTGVALANRGVISFQKCTPGAVNVTGTLFPVGNPVGAATTPITLADDCLGGAPVILPLQPYVILPICDQTSKITITKVVVGVAPLDPWEFTIDIPGYPPFYLLAGGESKTLLVPAGTWTITETEKPGYAVATSTGCDPLTAVPGSNPVTFTVKVCEEECVTFTNTFTCLGSITITKEVVGTPPLPGDVWEFTSDISGYENFTLPAIGGSIDFTNLPPGTYRITETTKDGYTVTSENCELVWGDSVSVFITIEGCENKACTFTNTKEEEGCQWCDKSAVLSQVRQNTGNEAGDECNQPDIIVDVRKPSIVTDWTKAGTANAATGSIQEAVDYINVHGDINGDGYLFIGVVATDGAPSTVCNSTCARPAAGDSPFGVENVVITNESTSRLNIFGCSVTMKPFDPSKPVITINNALGKGKITVLDIHVKESVNGYLVNNAGDLVVVKNGRAMGNDIGYLVKGSKVEISGSPEISGNRIGIEIDGSAVTLRTNSDIRSNSLYGIYVKGNSNELNGNEVGVHNFPNGVGIRVEGNSNKIHDDGVEYNSGNGIEVAGNLNILTGEDVNYNGGIGLVVSGTSNQVIKFTQFKFNGGGIVVSGKKNLLDGNKLESNTGIQFTIAATAFSDLRDANSLKKNESKAVAGKNFTIGVNNKDLKDNKANGTGFTFNGLGIVK